MAVGAVDGTRWFARSDEEIALSKARDTARRELLCMPAPTREALEVKMRMRLPHEIAEPDEQAAIVKADQAWLGAHPLRKPATA